MTGIRSVTRPCLLLAVLLFTASVASRSRFSGSGRREEKEEHVLARITPQIAHLSIGEVQFQSIVPVFGGTEHFLAFVMPWDEAKWGELQALDVHCVTPTGQRSKMEFFGGETGVLFKTNMVGRCDWPLELQGQDCHQVVVEESGAAEEPAAGVQQFSACHQAAMSKAGPYGLAACIRPLWEHPGHLGESGILALPQWVEFHMKHGVEHFLMYTTNNQDTRVDLVVKPYVDAKLMTMVHVEQEFPENHEGLRKLQNLIGNDCLYRMRHRAEYLLPGHVDVDEYLHFRGSQGSSSSSSGEEDGHNVNFFSALKALEHSSVSSLLQKGLSSVSSAKASSFAVHSVSFGRFTFRQEKDPQQTLKLASTMREVAVAPICPKYVLKPKLCNTLFVHWPTSWVEGSTSLIVTPDSLVGNHYRTQDETSTTSVDEVLAREAQEVGELLKLRYGVSWQGLAKSLAPEGPSQEDLMKPMLSLLDFHSEDLAADPAVAAWISKAPLQHYVNPCQGANSFTSPALVDPPGVGWD